MKLATIITILLVLIKSCPVLSQMNFQDSTVQVISYWNLGDKYEYDISLQKLEINKKDTTTNELMTYEVEVTVIDSTENSYTVRWFYKNFTSDSENPIVQKITSVAENIAVDIKIDNLGMIQSVENWKEVKEYMMASFDSIKSDVEKLTGSDRLLEQMKLRYTTKEAIEFNAIQDAHQFHNFHGGQYLLNDTLIGKMSSPNIYIPDQPFDAYVTVVLEGMDSVNNQYTMRSMQEVDSKQLTDASYYHLSQLAKEGGGKFVDREGFVDLQNSIETLSLIHNSGWVLESVLWKKLFAEGIMQMEIRTILMK